MSKIVDGDHANGSNQRFQQLDSIRGELFSATKIGACTCWIWYPEAELWSCIRMWWVWDYVVSLKLSWKLCNL